MEGDFNVIRYSYEQIGSAEGDSVAISEVEQCARY